MGTRLWLLGLLRSRISSTLLPASWTLSLSLLLRGWFNLHIPLLLRGSFLSSGLQPKHPHILHPLEGNFVFLTSSGTWHKHDLFDFEKAFIHFRQHPLRASKSATSLSRLFIRFCLSPGLYSGSSPLLMKSYLEQPLQPQVWHPCYPIYVLLCPLGTTHTQAFLDLSVCLHILQH